jgi:hypothetical protein
VVALNRGFGAVELVMLEAQAPVGANRKPDICPPQFFENKKSLNINTKH